MRKLDVLRCVRLRAMNGCLAAFRVGAEPPPDLGRAAVELGGDFDDGGVVLDRVARFAAAAD